MKIFKKLHERLKKEGAGADILFIHNNFGIAYIILGTLVWGIRGGLAFTLVFAISMYTMFWKQINEVYFTKEAKEHE